MTVLRHHDGDLAELILSETRTPAGDRPWLVANMVVSVDGATTMGPVSGPLSGPADHKAFMALRAASDVILVGAGTVRAERYGPPKADETMRARRVAGGMSERPRLAVVSARLDLDWDEPLFDDDPLPILVTVEDAPPERLAQARERAHVITAGTGKVDLAQALRSLPDSPRVILCEGGPLLLSLLYQARVVDELCLTITPLIAGDQQHRLLGAAGLDIATPLRLTRAIERDGFLLLRYLTEREAVDRT